MLTSPLCPFLAVGIIALINKGLRPRMRFNVVVITVVGIIALINKGLRQEARYYFPFS